MSVNAQGVFFWQNTVVHFDRLHRNITFIIDVVIISWQIIGEYIPKRFSNVLASKAWSVHKLEILG